MGKKETLNGGLGDWEIVADKPVKETGTDWEIVSEPTIGKPKTPEGQLAYESAMSVDTDTDQFEQILTNIPDINDAQKSNLRKLALNVKAGKATHEDLRDTILTYQNKNPKQDGSGQYYITENMTAKPLASGERPPKGYDVANDYWGTQEEADKKGFLASAGSHLYNGVLKGVLGLETLANLPYAMATGEDADWYKAAQNRVESSLMKTPSYETEQELFDAKDIKGIGDFFDSDRYNFTKNTVQGAALSGLESITSFLIGTKGVGAAGTALSAVGKGSKLLTAGGKAGAFLEGTTSAGAKAQAIGGAYAITLPEVLQYVEDAGITGEEKYKLSAAIAVPVALTEMIGGTEALFAKNAAAKKAKSAVIRGAVDAVKRNADGPLTKEFLTETFKATTKEAAQLNKSFLRELGENVLEEAGTEGLQEFEKQGLAELYDHISKEDHFKKNPLSLEAFGEYYNAALQGGLGSIGAGAVGTLQKRSIDLHEKQSSNIFEVVKRGPEAIGALKENVAKSVADGEITKEQADELMFKVDAYDTYNKQTSGIPLEDADKKKVFELTFEKSNLDSQIPPANEQKDLNGIEQAKIDAKKKQSKDIQSEINDIIQKAEVMNKTTTAAKKTVEDVDKKIESETEKPAEGKKPMSKTLQDLTNKYRGTEFETLEGLEKPKVKEEKKTVKVDERPFESIPPIDWNQKKHAEKFVILRDKLVKDNDTVIGNLTLMKGADGRITNDTIHVEMPGKKFVITASSARDLKTQLRGHFKTEFVKEENIDTHPVIIKPLQLTSGKTVLGIYGEESGRFISYVREHETGKSKYSEQEIDELQHLQAASKLTKAELEYYKQKRNQPPTDEGEAGATEIVKPKPKGPTPTTSGVFTPTTPYGTVKGEELTTQTTTNETTETGPVREPEQGAKEVSKESKKAASKVTKEEIRDRALQIKSKVEKYNSLSKTDKKSEHGRDLYRFIVDSASEIGHTVEIGNNGKLSLKTPKGKKVHRTPVKRSEDVIKEEKYKKEKQRRALNMAPQSFEQLVVQDVANGERFDKKQLEDAVVLKTGKDIPSLFTDEKNGIQLEFYKLRFAQTIGVDTDSLQGDEDWYTDQAAKIISEYLFNGGRQKAIDDAIIIYEKLMNGGLTDAQIAEQQDLNNLTDSETGTIVELVNGATEEEVDKSLNKLENENNQTEQTANEIASDLTGKENPFNEEDDESEGESDIITDGPDDVFQKPKELEYAEGQLAKAEKELKSAKSAFETKRKELGKEINADQEDLFGERQSTEGAGLFDERVDMSVYEGVIAPFKQRYAAAVKEYIKWQNKVKELEDKEDSQTSLFQKEKLKNIKNEADSIIKGKAVFKRLSQQEERGRIEGGRINVEASIILAGIQEAGVGTKRSGKKIQRLKETEESSLEEYAKENGIWHENTSEEFGEPHANGFEQDVYLTKNGVLKINNGLSQENWMELLDRISIHNSLFPGTKYEVIGFGRDANGEFMTLLKQPTIIGGPAKFSEVKADLMKRGYEPINESDTESVADVVFRNKTNGTIISDVHGENVIKGKNGQIYYIDPIVAADTVDAGYGGTRVIKSKLIQDVERVVEYMRAAVPNVKIVYDENLKAAGKWSPSTKTITINPYYAGLDTPIHEVGHILIDAMGGMKNKVINNAINQLKGTDLWNETKERYPELNNEQLGYEVLAEAIGMEGAGIFDKQVDKNIFMKYLEYIFDWLKRNLGLEKNIARNLAKQIIAGIGTDVITEGEEVFQKEKGKKEYKEYHAKSEKQRAYDRRLNITQYRKQKFGAFPEDEVRDLNELDSIINDENSSPDDVETATILKNQILRKIKGEKSSYMQYLSDLKIADLYDKELSEGVSEKRLAEIINDLYTLQPEAAAEAQNRAKMMLAYGMFTKRKDELKKNEKFIEAVADKSDITTKDVYMKNLGHMTEAVPELQSFSKMFDKTHLDMAEERKKLKHTFETLGLAVIKEANKKLGIVGKAASVFSSDSAKYFEYLDDGKGNLLTEEQARAKGLSDAQIAFLKNYRDLIAERYRVTEDDLYNAELEVLKTDPTFAEAFKTNGIVDAMSRFLGNSYNLNKTRIPFKNPNTGINEVTDFQTIESELIKYGKKGIVEKAKAVGLLIHYNMKAKHQLKKGVNYDEDSHPLELKDSGEYSVDYKGELVGKFGRPRDKNRGYSKDFYRAGIEFIDELTHTKHMSPLVPVINGIEFLNERGFKEHAKKPEVVKWIQDWRDMHLFKNTKQTIPEIDIALRFLRFMTSATTMMFNVPASTMNLAMGIYNNWRAENADKVAIGHSRLFGDIGKHKVNKEYGYGTINPYAVDILRKFDIVSIDYDSNPKKYIGRIFENLGHGLTRYGEFQIQGSMFLGLLTKDEYNSFEYKKNKYGVDELVFKEGMTEEQIEKLKDKLISYKNRVSDIQGKYGDKDRRNIMNTELGKSVLQFKVWVPDWWKERFGKEYINSDGQTVRGTWKSFYGEGLKQLRNDIKEKGAIKAFWEDKGAMSNLKGLLAVATLLVLQYSDDDDEKKKRTALSLDSAMGNLLFIFDPDQLKYMLKNPIGAVGTVEKFINLSEAMLDLDAEKTGKAALRLTPVYKAQKSVEEISRLVE